MLTPGQELQELRAIRQRAMADGYLVLAEEFADDVLALLGPLPDHVHVVVLTSYAPQP